MKKSLSFALMLIAFGICTMSSRAKVVTVNVDIPGTLGTTLLSKVDQLSDVTELTVVGKLKDSDLKVLSGLINVTKIDMSQTDIKQIAGCKNLSKLQTILLPSTVTAVQKEAFYQCGSLKQINMPNAETIGENAFYYCSSLTTANFPQATSTGENAFYSCKSLTTASFPQATSIGYQAFSSCTSLTTASFPQATSIGSRAFYECISLTTVSFPQATSIGSSAFYNCTSLTTVSFPQATSIGSWAFQYAAIKTISLPTTLQVLGDGAFSYCSRLTDVYCYVVSPLETSPLSGSGITLHVPAFSVGAYKLDANWNKVGKIVALDGEMDNICINSDFTVTELKGVAKKADLNVGADYKTSLLGHLTVLAKEKWTLKDYVQDHNYETQSTLIPYSEMTADNVSVKYSFDMGRWYFISFPFDVNVSDIEYPEGTLWVIRKYSGEDRAKGTGKTWQNMTNGMTLKAGEGYILHCSNSGSESSYDKVFTFKAVNNSNKNNIFASKDVAKSLSTYMSDLPHNRSWNLVGNPFPCFYDTRHLEHNGVITVWNGSGYTAYSLRDDNYVLRPHEAFFVQCPDGASSMKFKVEGRQHTYEVASQSTPYRKSPANSCRRQVYNFTLSGADYTDKARVVINESATTDYELSCDASKFVSDNPLVPQLYIIEDNQQMAIDERPLSDGEITLGMYIGEPGEYTIALDNVSADNVTLIDSATGNTVNLNTDTYTFSASHGTIDDRFVIQIGEATGVKEVPADERSAKTTVYSIGGLKLSNPQKGINIINGNKILVR